MSLRRRDFLTTTGMAAAGLAGAAGARALGLPGPADQEAGGESIRALTADGQVVEVGTMQLTPAAESGTIRDGVPGRRWAMVIDLATCDGCDDCVVVCREHHRIGADRDWIRIYRMQDSPEAAPYWFPKPCYHCDNPPCTKVCPVGATFKRTDGLVLIDSERCIGCRFCMAACPYSARVFNWSRPEPAGTPNATRRRIGTVEKCDFCADGLPHGELPHCVTACTMGAVYFGDANEDAVTNGRGETERLSQLLHDRAGYRFHEDLGTQPRVYYLPPSARRYPAPQVPGSHTAAPAAEAAASPAEAGAA
jgi:Fe-S-cluster-containing dehydrogenase component